MAYLPVGRPACRNLEQIRVSNSSVNMVSLGTHQSNQEAAACGGLKRYSRSF